MSLPSEDVEFLDAYAQAHALRSRSAALQQAVRALRLGELGDAYGQAWSEWADTDDSRLWESTAGDAV